MSDILLDVNIVVDICSPRPAYEAMANAAVEFCKLR